MAGMYCLKDLLNLAVRERAAELWIEAGQSPVMRAGDETRTIDLPTLTWDNVAELFSSFATWEQTEELRRCGDVHFNYTSPASDRFAVRASTDRHTFTLRIRPLINRGQE